jgi:hypothetical protein
MARHRWRQHTELFVPLSSQLFPPNQSRILKFSGSDRIGAQVVRLRPDSLPPGGIAKKPSFFAARHVSPPKSYPF